MLGGAGDTGYTGREPKVSQSGKMLQAEARDGAMVEKERGVFCMPSTSGTAP